MFLGFKKDGVGRARMLDIKKGLFIGRTYVVNIML